MRVVIENFHPVLSDSTIEGMQKVLMLSGGTWGEKSNNRMLRVEELAADAERFREMRTSEQVLDFLEDRFRSLGVTAFLVTGIPLPGRPIEPLLLRNHWGEQRGEGVVAASDALFAAALRSTRPQVAAAPQEEIVERSELYRAALDQGADSILCVPVRGFLPYQAVVVGAGEGISLDRLALLTLDYLCEEAFRRLFGLRVVAPERPGDLSGRERKVVALSAEGKTASDIAKLLAISQRTVHAHLQNASDKLRAQNKTQTVVEALRYGQITL